MKEQDFSGLIVSTTKPRGRVARTLAEMGVRIAPIVEDEGNVDRYVLSKRLVVERRTGGGFLKGIMDKTLFTSAIYMREHYAIPILIVEGRVNYSYSMMDPQAVRGALSSMLIQYGLNVLSTADADETVQLILMLTRQEQVGIPEISLIPKRRATSLDDLQRRVIEMLPGCGRVMARDLLQRFGSVRRIADATAAELESMRGIGARKAAQMHAVLGADYEAVDTEKNIEDAVEAEPKLLFRRKVELLARQHHIFTDARDRHVVDLVFLDRKGRDLVLVELKHGVLTSDSVAQVCRYLDNARQSKLLAPYLDGGYSVRGLLATVAPVDLAVARPDVTVRHIDSRRVIKVLLRLRKENAVGP